MRGREYLVCARKRIDRSNLRHQLTPRRAVRVPVEEIDPVRARRMPLACHRAGTHLILRKRIFRTHEPREVPPIHARVEPRIDRHLRALAHAEVLLHRNERVCMRPARGNEYVDQALLDPRPNVITDAVGHLRRARHARGQVIRPPPSLRQLVGHPTHRPLNVRYHIAKPIAVVVRQMEAVPLPVQLDAVPIPASSNLLHVLEPVLAYLRHLQIPRQRKPRRRLVPKQPLGMLDPHSRKLAVPQGRQIGRLRAAKVVVVHPHRRIDLHTQTAAALDDLCLRILAALDHGDDVLVEREGLRALIHPPVNVPNRLQNAALPSRGMLPHTPKMSANLRILHRRIDLLDELLHRLWILRVGVRVPVPVVYQSIVRRLWHRIRSFTFPESVE